MPVGTVVLRLLVIELDCCLDETTLPTEETASVRLGDLEVRLLEEVCKLDRTKVVDKETAGVVVRLLSIETESAVVLEDC